METNRNSNTTAPGAPLSLVSLDYHSDHSDNENDQEQNHEVWTMCIDQNTGCPYYWEQNSNKVSWEPPPGYVAPVKDVDPVAAVPSYNTTRASRRTITNQNDSQTPLFPAAKLIEKKLPSEDEEEEEPEEKIELITSYYNHESGSEDEADVKSGKKKNSKERKSGKKNIIADKKLERSTSFGPVLPVAIQKNIFNSDMNHKYEENSNNDSNNVKEKVGVEKFSKFLNSDDRKSSEESVDKEPDKTENDAKEIRNDKLKEIGEPLEVNKFVEKKRKITFEAYTAKYLKRDNEESSQNKAKDLTYTTKYSESYEISGHRVGLGFAKPYDKSEEEKKTGAIIFEKGETIVPESESSSLKTQVLKEQELLGAKLKYLTSIISPVPIFHRLNIELKVLWTAYEVGELSAKYMNGKINELAESLQQEEKHVVSPPWTYCYHSDKECYMYENSETGECQKEHPSEQDMDICNTPPPGSPSSPPSAPLLSLDNRLHGLAQQNLECGDLVRNHLYPDSDFSHSKIEGVKPSEENLVAALDSFYSDIAALGETEIPKPETSSKEATADKSNTNSTGTSQVKEGKKKSKTKVLTTTGLKNKSMSSLVAKWKQVQESL